MMRHSTTKVDSISFYSVRVASRQAESKAVTKMDGCIDSVVDAALEYIVILFGLVIFLLIAFQLYSHACYIYDSHRVPYL